MALGAVDELNAAIGVCRVHAEGDLVECLNTIQKHLVSLMGEVATLPEDRVTYQEKGYGQVTEQEVLYLEGLGKELEDSGIRFRGWARPGKEQNVLAAFLDVARTIARRAERESLALGGLSVSVTLFLNRLSDMLWLLAREQELEA